LIVLSKNLSFVKVLLLKVVYRKIMELSWKRKEQSNFSTIKKKSIIIIIKDELN
jgi:hypothetical protein